MTYIFNQIRTVKKQVGAAEALLSYAVTDKEKLSATEHLATVKARLDVLQSHFEHA